MAHCSRSRSVICPSSCFIGTHMSHVDGYFLKLLVVTGTCASAGIDCSSINNIIYHGFLPSIINLVLAVEKTMSHQIQANFILLLYWRSFVSYCTGFIEEVTQKSEQHKLKWPLILSKALIKWQCAEVWKVLQLLVLKCSCVHAKIAKSLVSPLSPPCESLSRRLCATACPTCQLEFRDLFFLVSHVNSMAEASLPRAWTNYD